MGHDPCITGTRANCASIFSFSWPDIGSDERRLGPPFADPRYCVTNEDIDRDAPRSP
jgi:hypothetical protein